MGRNAKFQWKKFRFEENYNCLFGGENEKRCDTYVLPSIILDMYLQKNVNLHCHLLTRNVKKETFLKLNLGIEWKCIKVMSKEFYLKTILHRRCFYNFKVFKFSFYPSIHPLMQSSEQLSVKMKFHSKSLFSF